MSKFIWFYLGVWEHLAAYLQPNPFVCIHLSFMYSEKLSFFLSGSIRVEIYLSHGYSKLVMTTKGKLCFNNIWIPSLFTYMWHSTENWKALD
jgi:hypothetical protein